MTKEDDERPRPRPRQRRVVPDPTDGREDPVTHTAASTNRGRARRGYRTADAYVQLNTRVDPELNELIEQVSSKRRWSKRDVVEEALRTAYAEEYQQVRARNHAQDEGF